MFRRTTHALLVLLAAVLGPACDRRCARAEGTEGPAARQRAAQALEVLQTSCIDCHGGKITKHGLDLTTREGLLRGGDGGPAVVPGQAAKSRVYRRITHAEKPGMPYRRERLSEAQIALIADWINAGAPYDRSLGSGPKVDDGGWWSLKPLRKLTPPDVRLPSLGDGPQNAIDRFLFARLQEKGLAPSPPADKRTWLRRVTFDLTGLPPTPAETNAFLADDSRDAFTRVAERLLASPRYGERWARHWMDVVHYAETHGHDQDRPRPNAWPYRDYLIRSFNDDKPYARFVQEQLAGDQLFPDDPQATVALGFLATGPWDESSLRDIRDDTIDREIARYLDRDDMVTTAMSTFVSMTVHCARCHAHKFDPITQQDYYALQAVFAGVDKAERPYDADPGVAARRRSLQAQQAKLHAPGLTADPALLAPGVQADVAAWEKNLANQVKWITLDPISSTSAGGATLTRQPDLSVLASGKCQQTDTYTIVAATDLQAITGIRLEVLTDASLPHQGPGRQDNGNLHLTEFQVKAAPKSAPAKAAPVLLQHPRADFEQEGWTIAHAIDGKPETAWGIYPQVGKPHRAVFETADPTGFKGGTLFTFVLEQNHGRSHLIGRLRLSVTTAPRPFAATGDLLPQEITQLLAVPAEKRSGPQKAALAVHVLNQRIQQQLAALPAQQLVYSATNDFRPDGSFRPAKLPRQVHILRRGDINQPGEAAGPGALACVAGLEGRFHLADLKAEGGRRAALARWVTDRRNMLAWRSIVNRVWHYHFGRGIVDTPNDFGRMGGKPSHPELLDWLTVLFQEHGGSLKYLHKLIVTSAAYRQTTQHQPRFAEIDADNRYLWRMNRTRLDAESIRDAVLQASGKLDLKMGGPSVKQFIEKPGIHVTPLVDYLGFDVDRPENYRRSVYRFLFRTLPDPFMEALDCADSSQLTPARTTSVSALQALAMLNDRFIVRQSEHLAGRAARAAPDLPGQVRVIYEWTLGRLPTLHELELLTGHAKKHGLANVCRLLFNSNEFMFVN